MRTGISELDEMIGLKSMGEGMEEIPPKNVVLIRGEPGSGKTTLGLQILSHNARRPTAKNILYISLEQNPELVLSRVQESFQLFQDIDVKKINVYNRDRLEKILKPILTYSENKQGQEEIKEKIREIISDNEQGSDFEGLFISICMHITLEAFTAIDQKYAGKIIDQKREVFNEIELILFDSLDVFVEIVKKYRETISERLIINAINQSLAEIFPNAVFLFTSEYHYWDPNKKTAVSESFLCDIEISLFSEPTVVPRTWNAQFASPLGNNYLSLLKDNSASLHIQSFCRVLKSRNFPNQSRRCSYDILTGKGVEFFPSYPGDGHILLFTENEQQKKIWNTFWEEDIPASYPSLRHELFDRISLQRTSNVWRRIRYLVPTRTDLILTSFDNYWINWYEEIYIKWMIMDSLNQVKIFEIIPEKRFLYKLVNAIDAAIIMAELDKHNLSALTDLEGLRCIRCMWIESIVGEAMKRFHHPRKLNNSGKKDDIWRRFLADYLELFQKYNMRSKEILKNRDGCITEEIIQKSGEIREDRSGLVLQGIYRGRIRNAKFCHWRKEAKKADRKIMTAEIIKITEIFFGSKILNIIGKIYEHPEFRADQKDEFYLRLYSAFLRIAMQ